MDEDDYYRFFDELVERCEWLLAKGPATALELARTLEAESFFDEIDGEHDPYASSHADLVDETLSGSLSLIHSSVNNTWNLIETVFDGRVFVHRLTAAEIDGDYLTIAGGLEVIDTGVEEDDWLFGGQVANTESSSSDYWQGKPGWLANYDPGDLCAVTRSDGELSLSPVGDSDLADGEREREVMAQWLSELEPGVGGDPAMWLYDWLPCNELIFTEPVPPFHELMAAVGFEERDRWYGPANKPWVPPYVKRQSEELDDIIASFDLDRKCRQMIEVVADAWSEYFSASIDPEARTEFDDREVAGALSHSFVAAAFEALLDERKSLTYAEYPLFLAALSAHGGRSSVGAHYLLGRHMILREGRTVDGVEAYKRAVRADDGYPLAQYAMAEIEFYEGCFEDGIRRLNRCGMSSSELQSFVPEPNGSAYQAGRNEPCPCGSGRKFKACHGGSHTTQQLSVRDRLNAKVQRFLFEEEQFNRIGAVRMAVFGPDHGGSSTGDPEIEFLLDLACHEGGMLAEFLDTYGVLLADDEFALAEAQTRTRRGLYEVVEVHAGESITLRNVRDGDETTIRERTASRSVRTGEYMLGRVLLDGPETNEPTVDSNPLSVDMRHRDEVLAALDEDEPITSMLQLALWFRRASEPPSIQLSDSLKDLMSEGDIGMFESGDIWSTLPERQTPPPRPQPGSPEYDIICEVIAEHEAGWLTESIPALKGATPVDAADDPTQRGDLLRLLDSMPQTNDPTVMSGLRLRQALGL